MDSSDRPGSKGLIQGNHSTEGQSQSVAPVLAQDKWPAPCSARGDQAPGVCLFLTLHCPKCGQLANLDDGFAKQICLLEERRLEQLLLYGSHHEYEQ